MFERCLILSFVFLYIVLSQPCVLFYLFVVCLFPDPTFISSTYIPNEEKVYFFFSEMGREYDFIDKFTVSRVAQVCTVRHFLCFSME